MTKTIMDQVMEEKLKGFIQLDEWQREVIESTQKYLAIRAGRQVGKSTVVSLKTALYALKNPKKTVLIIASVDRQALLLFEKVVETILYLDPAQVGKKRDKPTKHHMKLKNGTNIHCLPTGRTGYGIRGYSVDLLIADEAAFIPQEVWTAIIPMLAVTKGSLILLSTPYGKAGYFYECFQDSDFQTWHISSENCPRMDQAFLDKQKKRMTKKEYAQEFLGEFLDHVTKFFSRELIDKCMVISDWVFGQNREYYLGVDFARYGGDENAFVVAEKVDRNNFHIVHVETSDKVSTAETIQRLLALERQYKFRKIYIDEGGMGGPILDQLLVTNSVKRKVVGIDNASKPINVHEGRRKIMKEDLYGNLLRMMEQGTIKMVKDENLFYSLDSTQFDYTDAGSLKIFSRYNHPVEALVRAVFPNIEKPLNIIAHTF